jgi:hypothetical protein
MGSSLSLTRKWSLLPLLFIHFPSLMYVIPAQHGYSTFVSMWKHEVDLHKLLQKFTQSLREAITRTRVALGLFGRIHILIPTNGVLAHPPPPFTPFLISLVGFEKEDS